MSMQFDGTGDNVALTDNAALTLASATGWSLSMWVKAANWTGSVLRNIFSWGSYYATPSILFTIADVSHATLASRMVTLWHDADTAGLWYYSDNDDDGKFTTTDWNHICVVRSGNTATFFIRGHKQTATCNMVNIGDINVAANLTIGATTNERWNGNIAEIAKWDRALGDEEVAGLAGGNTALWYPTGLAWYCPWKTTSAESIVPLTVTLGGDAVVNAGVHPTMIDPSTGNRRRRLLLAGAAA